jgi:hypothetical protein
MIISGVIIFGVSCKNTTVKETTKPATESTAANSDHILIGKDIITEVIVRLDTIDDPWEVEKVKNYDGKKMFTYLFENIYAKKIQVYDILSGEALTPENVKKLEKEFGSDLSRITKIQFVEDWYFNPLTNSIIKNLKSASFGYNALEDGEHSTRYKPLFRLTMNQ